MDSCQDGPKTWRRAQDKERRRLRRINLSGMALIGDDSTESESESDSDKTHDLEPKPDDDRDTTGYKVGFAVGRLHVHLHSLFEEAFLRWLTNTRK